MFKKLWHSIIESRQRKANMMVAQQLAHIEYPNETVEYILANLQNFRK